MFRRNKIEKVGTISEFMSVNVRKQEIDYKPLIKTGIIAGASVLCITFGDVGLVSANALDGAVMDKVTGAFTPVIELVRALSYPIGLVMMLGGGLFVMIGNSERGLAMIQKAGLGYVLIQMLPILMDLLVDIARSF